MAILRVENVSHGFGDRTILEKASFSLLNREHVALVGANGEGKTTFLNIIMGNIIPDEGKITWCRRLTVGYLDQHTRLEPGKTVRQVLQDAFKYMYDLENEMNTIYEKMCDCTEKEMEEYLEDVGEIQSILDAGEFYNLDKKIEEVASGLGLKDIGLETDVTMLSGGQRSKVLLTKLLLENPKILVLDEPTNFLDENHIRWLTNYLQEYENAFILVSHDIPFVEAVCNVIYHLEQGNMTRYTGSYQDFMNAYEVKKRQQEALYERQQREIADLEDFIARNKARVATRAMAASRQKRLDKMEIIEKVSEKPKPTFRFNEARTPGRILVEVKDLVLGYDHALTKPINLVLERNRKYALKGVNGIGKSTFLKTILGLVKPFSGEVFLDQFLEVGYFEQESVSSRNTALEEIWQEYPSMTNAEVRGALASCGLTKQHIESLMLVLSGGENAKVRLCKIMIKECNFLVLDEPTNHLDQDAKESLKEALKKFKGSVLIVSHEPDFYQDIVDEQINAEAYSLKVL